MKKVAIKKWDELADREPAYALVGNVDLVVVRYGERCRFFTAAACTAGR